jgi:hypothetical protein
MSEQTSKKRFCYSTRKIRTQLTWEISEPGRRRSENASVQELVERVRSTPLAGPFFKEPRSTIVKAKLE